MMAHAFNFSIQEAKTGQSLCVKGWPGLHNEFQATLSLKKKSKNLKKLNEAFLVGLHVNHLLLSNLQIFGLDKSFYISFTI